MDRFFALLSRNGRMELVPDILRNFVTLYRRSIGVCKAHLTAVAPPSEHLLQSLQALVKGKTGADVIFDVDVDPSLVGGFVLDLDSYLLDASVKRQLEMIREQFIERNRRII
jgi:F-type H+-transporting ATPase subunit delta